MKKILFLGGIFLTITSSFALTIDPTPTKIENATKNGILYLDNGENIFAEYNNDDNKKIKLAETKNHLNYDFYNIKNITITCKNGVISEIQGYVSHTNPNYTQTGNFQSLILDYNYTTATSPASFQSFVTLQCNPITPDKVIDESTDINYAQVTQKTDSLLPPFPKTIAEPQISSTTIEENFASGKIPNEQPTFIDVNYLQLSNIGNLLNSIIIQYPSINISDLFSNYSEYTGWINKFKTYPNKEDFINAFSGAITLKDIGIAQDIINGLYKDLNSGCLSKNSCEKINFKNPNDKFQVYNFDEIESTLYKTSNNLINQATGYYQKMETQCSNLSNIHDNFLKEQTENLCKSLFTGETDSVGALYNLGYALGQRIKNLDTIKSNLGSTGTNLLGIYNIYWELNNLSIGAEKTALVKQANNPSLDTTGQSEILQKIPQIDISLLSKGIIPDIDTTKNTTAIVQTIGEGLTYNSSLYDTIKSNIPNVNLFDINSFNVNNGIISGISDGTKEISFSVDANKIISDSANMSDAEFTDGYNKVSAKINGNFEEFSYTYIPGGIYIKTEKLQDFEEDKKECYDKHTIPFLIVKCLYDNLKKYDYVNVYILHGYTYRHGTYHQKEE